MQSNAELMVVSQLPVITEQLESVKEALQARVINLSTMDCTDETLTQVRAARADLRKEFNEFEARRKEIKAAVAAPYLAFEQTYKDCIATAYQKADTELGRKITNVEAGMKSECVEFLIGYFTESCLSLGIDFVSFEQLGLTVTLTDARAKTPKKLMSQIDTKLDTISKGLEAISMMEEGKQAEVLAEFRKCLDLPKAISAVESRRREVADAEQRTAALKEQKQAEAARVADAMQYAPPPEPVVVPAPTEPAPATVADDPVLTLTFTVTAPKSRLKALKAYLVENGLI